MNEPKFGMPIVEKLPANIADALIEHLRMQVLELEERARHWEQIANGYFERITELECDRERLDWLEVASRQGKNPSWFSDGGVSFDETPGDEIIHDNLREAIDAARSAHPEDGDTDE